MAYEVWVTGWEVRKDGTEVPGAYVTHIEFPEIHRDWPDGKRTYHLVDGLGIATVRLLDGTVANVPVKLK